MDIKISKEKMLEMAQKLARMDFCPEQKVFYKNVLELLQADAEGRLLVHPRGSRSGTEKDGRFKK